VRRGENRRKAAIVACQQARRPIRIVQQMFAFAVYAVLVWAAAARWRRQWESFAWVGAAFAGLLLVAYFHYLLSVWTHGQIYLPVLRSLLYPYTAVVVAVGVFIACLPTARRGRIECPRCAYDLHGLQDDHVNSCPECGQPFMIVDGYAVRVFAEPITPAAPPRKRVTPATRGRQRRRPGPAPVVLRWPPA